MIKCGWQNRIFMSPTFWHFPIKCFKLEQFQILNLNQSGNADFNKFEELRNVDRIQISKNSFWGKKSSFQCEFSKTIKRCSNTHSSSHFETMLPFSFTISIWYCSRFKHLIGICQNVSNINILFCYPHFIKFLLNAEI